MPDIVVETLRAARSFDRGGKTVEALAPTTCSVRAGDRVALVGPSGSGKSTLLHLMAALDRPSTGEIHWPLFGDSGAAQELRLSAGGLNCPSCQEAGGLRSA